MKKLLVTTIVSFLVASISSSAAFAQGEISIGGKKSATVVASLTTIVPDGGSSATTLLVGSTLGYITPKARFEFSVGLFILAPFDGGQAQLYSPVVEGRINTDLMGPEENFLAYLGVVAGASIISGSGVESLTVGTYGPKMGIEYYITPSVAVQLEDRALWTSNSSFTNALTVGLKLLF